MLVRLFVPVLLLFSIFVGECNAGQVNAFIYHRFDETRYPSTNISAEIFTQQLEYIKQQQVEVISLRQIVSRLIAKEELPSHAVSICVDDAFRSFYDVGMPIIRKYGIPVTLFVNTAAVGSSGYLNWDELRELAAEGVEIENHTDTHPYLVELEPDETYGQWQQRIQSDILRSQQQFEQQLGFRPTLFAYPFGEYSADVVELIKETGFE
ncbi:MAG: polysaccharide deacetylase family protein, partial [Desulfuromonadales bacterium]|nr:polysaccharide deacetylase family protein [Desulfuromonadales bacterium]